MQRLAALALAVVVVVVDGHPARADEAPQLPYSLTVDSTIAGVGIAAWIGSELAKPWLAPSSCRWCATDALDTSVRDALKWSDTKLADDLSNGALVVQPLLVGGLLAGAAALDGHARESGVDILLMAEATALALDMNQLVKYAVGRERPFVHYGHPAHNDDDDLSFYSGHTTYTMAIAVSAGTIASMRHRRWAPLVWGVGIAAALTTGYLRMGADKHWFTDVATGAVLGGATGFAVPYLLHRPREWRGATLRLQPLSLPAGAGLALGGAW